MADVIVPILISRALDKRNRERQEAVNQQRADASAADFGGQVVRFTSAGRPIDLVSGFTAITSIPTWAALSDTWPADNARGRLANPFAQGRILPIGKQGIQTADEGRNQLIVTQEPITLGEFGDITFTLVSGSAITDEKFSDEGSYANPPNLWGEWYNPNGIPDDAPVRNFATREVNVELLDEPLQNPAGRSLFPSNAIGAANTFIVGDNGDIYRFNLTTLTVSFVSSGQFLIGGSALDVNGLGAAVRDNEIYAYVITTGGRAYLFKKRPTRNEDWTMVEDNGNQRGNVAGVNNVRGVLYIYTSDCVLSYTEAVPAVPERPRLVATDGNTLEVSIPAVNETENYQWQLSADETFDSSDRILRTGNVNTPTARFTGLTPDTDYFIRVRAENSVGESDYSPVLRTRTSQLGTNPAERPTSRPTAKPRTPTVSSKSPTDIILNILKDKIASSYKWRISEDPNFMGPTTRERVTTENIVDWRDLDPNRRYYFDVETRNPLGSSPRSDRGDTTTDNTAPGRPPLPVFDSRTQNSISVRLPDEVEGAQRYRWRISTDSVVTDADRMEVTTIPQITITSLDPNTEYWIDCRSENSAGNSAYSADLKVATESDTHLPSVPTTPVLVSRTRTSITVSVTPVPGAETYHWRLSEDSTITQLDTTVRTNEPTATFTGLDIDSEYFIDARAENSAGRSNYSSALRTRTDTIPSVPTADTPILVSRTTTSITLRVNPVAGAVRYRFRISRDSNITNSDTFYTSTSPEITISGLTPGSDYFIDVRAESADRNGQYSTDLATSTGASVTTPNIPVATLITDTSISAEVDAVTNATRYRWRLSRNSTIDGNVESTILTNTNEVTFLSLQNGTAYFIDVNAENEFDTSDYSADLATRTFLPTPLPPVLVERTTTSINVSVTPVRGATQYRFRLSTDSTVEDSDRIQVSNQPMITFFGLDRNTNFWIDCRAETNVAISDYSADLATSTLATEPPLATPDTPTLVSRNNTSINVRTNEITGATLYRWRLSVDDTIDDSDTFQTSTEPMITFFGLNPDTPYWLDCRVENSASQSEYSTDLATRTEGNVPTVPSTPRLRVATQTSLQVSIPPVEYATLYRWRLSTDDTIEDSDTIQTSTEPTITFHGLTAQTHYWIDCRAENSAGNSRYSGDLSVRTLQVGEIQSNLKPTITVENVSNTSLTVRVTKPTNEDAPTFNQLSTVEVRYSTDANVDNDDSTESLALSTRTANFIIVEIDGLTADTPYWLDARFVSSSEQTEYSDVFATRTTAMPPTQDLSTYRITTPYCIATTAHQIMVGVKTVPPATNYEWFISTDSNVDSSDPNVITSIKTRVQFVIFGDNDGQVRTPDGSRTALTLQPDTPYWITVRAYNGSSTTVTSSAVMCRTEGSMQVDLPTIFHKPKAPAQMLSGAVISGSFLGYVETMFGDTQRGILPNIFSAQDHMWQWRLSKSADFSDDTTVYIDNPSRQLFRGSDNYFVDNSVNIGRRITAGSRLSATYVGYRLITDGVECGWSDTLIDN